MTKTLGISLIESMISLFLLAVLLLGLDAMQITAISLQKNTYFFSVAMQQVNQMTERLMACHKNNCDQQTMLWERQNADVLPNGTGKVSGHYPDYVITLLWGDKQMPVCQQNKIGKAGCLQLNVHIYA